MSQSETESKYNVQFETQVIMDHMYLLFQAEINHDELYFNDYARAVEIYQEAVIHITESREKFIYGMNLEASSLNMTTFLADVPNHISPEKNTDLNYCIGINVPTFYVGSHHSFTDMHVEDGYLDSSNIIHWGIDGAWKGWLLIHPNDNAKLNTLILESIQELKKIGQCENFHCSTPMNHKNIFLSPNFLRMNDIRYQVIVQRPGDLVYVGCMVYHQVINFGMNLAEAVNVGSNKWNAAANLCIPCSCPDNAITAIVRNSQSYETVRTHKTSIHRCDIDGCVETFPNKIGLNTHKFHHANATVRKLICITCNKPYKSKESLRKHVSRTHVHQKPICPNCYKPQTAQNLGRHIQHCLKTSL